MGRCNMLGAVLGAIVIIITGIFMFMKPHLIWELTEKWKSYRADELHPARN